METQDIHLAINRHTTYLKMYAMHFTRDIEDANDLVQDTALKAISYYAKFQEGTNMKGWLYTIMKNTFINNYRSITRRKAVVTNTEELSSSTLMYSSTVNQGDSRFVMDDIQRALGNLPETYYNPFIKYYEGYKYFEIADQLNIPIGTVKTRIHVARIMLKKNLKPYQSPYSKPTN